MRRELISNALKERFKEVSEGRIPRLEAAASGPASFFAEVREKLSAISSADANDLIVRRRGPDSWTTSPAGCRRSLMALSLGVPFDFQPGERPPLEPFMGLLNASRADAEVQVQLLSERYSDPLNFALPEEAEAREYVLARLMSHDRAQVERGRGGRFNRDGLLLKLNLVAVVGSRTADLRFLDALNYYYELGPAWTSPAGHDDTLLASYFALYAQTLAAQM
jgi:hypothetical protein